jgi:single-strand DNA-binding protein
MTRNPEMRRSTNDVAITTFAIAVDRIGKNPETGEKETDFFNIVAFRKTAEFVAKYLGKGRLVAVDGRLQSRSYIAQDGQKKTVIEILADSVWGLDRPRGEAAETNDAVQESLEADPFAGE